jgi:hypothetical protein
MSHDALVAIYLYKYEGLWVFDDAKAGLIQAPFVSVRRAEG